jgi:hypothetical protein
MNLEEPLRTLLRSNAIKPSTIIDAVVEGPNLSVNWTKAGRIKTTGLHFGSAETAEKAHQHLTQQMQAQSPGLKQPT